MLDPQTEQSLSSALTPYPEDALPNMPGTPLTAEEVAFLKPYLHPQYLQSKTVAILSQQFADASVLMLEKFLHADLASALETALAARDKSDGLDIASRSAPGAKKIPDMRVGHDVEGWEVIGPSTRQRYLALDAASTPSTDSASGTATIHKLLTEVLPSDAFRSWLGLITSYIPIAHKLEARRFRPGLDYTLARGEDDEARLDLRIGLTPGVKWEDIEGGEALGAWEVSHTNGLCSACTACSRLTLCSVLIFRRPISRLQMKTTTQRSTRPPSPRRPSLPMQTTVRTRRTRTRTARS